MRFFKNSLFLFFGVLIPFFVLVPSAQATTLWFNNAGAILFTTVSPDHVPRALTLPFGSSLPAAGGAVIPRASGRIIAGAASGAIEARGLITAAQLTKTIIAKTPVGFIAGSLLLEAALRYSDDKGWEHQEAPSTTSFGYCGAPHSQSYFNVSDSACVALVKAQEEISFPGKTVTFTGVKLYHGPKYWSYQFDVSNYGTFYDGSFSEQNIVNKDGEWQQISPDQAEGYLSPVVASQPDNSPLVNNNPSTGFPTEPIQASGPAQITNSSTTTNNNTTVNNTTVYNLSYSGDTITVSSPQLTTTTTNKTTGETTTSTTTTDTPADISENATVTDTDLPEQPTLYERKYPDGLTGVWNSKIADLKATPLFSLPQVFAPSIDGGSCPTWTFNANLGGVMNYGSGTISPPCFIWPFLKAIMVIGALMLARALIFGG